MNEVTDEMLSAYLDGELEPADAARVATLIASNADLALRLARHRKLDELLREAAPEVPTPDYDPLVERILGAEPTARRAPAWSASQGFAVAAALAVAVLAGVGLGRYAGPQTELQAARAGLTAQGALAVALDRQPSGPAQGPVRVTLSFRAGDQRLCRQFVLRGSVQGLACREAGAWRVLAAAEQPGEDGYRTAGGEDGPIDRAVQGLGAQLLDPAEEVRAIKGGWR